VDVGADGYVYPPLATGEPGVRHILELLRQQIDEVLAFLGVRSIADLDHTYIQLPSSWRSAGVSRSAEKRSLEAALAPREERAGK
jgi:hypothetical protein